MMTTTTMATKSQFCVTILDEG